MSATDHARPARHPEHGDRAPRHQHRPSTRRARTRRQAVLAALKEYA